MLENLKVKAIPLTVTLEIPSKNADKDLCTENVTLLKITEFFKSVYLSCLALIILMATSLTG